MIRYSLPSLWGINTASFSPLSPLSLLIIHIQKSELPVNTSISSKRNHTLHNIEQEKPHLTQHRAREPTPYTTSGKRTHTLRNIGQEKPHLMQYFNIEQEKP